MKIPCSWLALVSIVFISMLSTTPLAAQAPNQGNRGGRGNFNPEEFRQRMMDRYREQLEVKNDDEWKLIEGRIEKVMEARREAGNNLRFGGFGGRRGGPGGQGGPGGRGPGGGEPNPEVEGLQKALESNASSDVIKTKIAALRASRKASQAKLDKAQADLSKVLSVRQEATALMMGLID